MILLLALVGGVFMLYRHGARGAADPPEPVGAPIRDVRAAAPPQSAPQDPAAGLTIYKPDPNEVAPPTYAPPPEQPLARPAQASAAGSAPASTPVVAAASKPATSVDAKADHPVEAAAAKPAPAKVVGLDDLLNDQPGARAKATGSPAADAGERVASKTVSLQIGAFSSEALADKGWKSAMSAGGLHAMGKKVVPVSKDGATLYRTSITGFASKAEAKAACDTLKAAGRTCIVR